MPFCFCTLSMRSRPFCSPESPSTLINLAFFLRGPGMRLPFLQSWFTLLGWRARKERTMSNLKSMYAIAKLKKNIKGFGLRTFKQEALQVYTETCQLLAEGDQSRLRQVSPVICHTGMSHGTACWLCLRKFCLRRHVCFSQTFEKRKNNLLMASLVCWFLGTALIVVAPSDSRVLSKHWEVSVICFSGLCAAATCCRSCTL